MNKHKVFWEWFNYRNEYIYHNLEDDTDTIAFEITEAIKNIHLDLEFEIPFDLKEGKRELIISADGIVELFPLVEEIVSTAPKLKNWIITAFRPRLHQKNQIIDLEGITMDYNDIFFSYEESTNGLNISVFIKGFDGEDNRYIHLYFLLLDSLIGEYDSVNCINNTTIYPLSNQEDLLALPKLLDIIDTYKSKNE